MMRWSSGTLPSQRMAAAASQSVLSFGSATLISSNCWIRASACADVAGSGASSAWTSLRRVVLNLSNDSRTTSSRTSEDERERVYKEAYEQWGSGIHADLKESMLYI